MTQKLPFQLLPHRGIGEGATPFPGLLHFTLDPYLIMLSVKQGGIKYHFWAFGMTRPGIEPWSSGLLVNSLLNWKMVIFKFIQPYQLELQSTSPAPLQKVWHSNDCPRYDIKHSDGELENPFIAIINKSTLTQSDSTW